MDGKLTLDEKKLHSEAMIKFCLPAFLEQFVVKLSVLAGAAFLGHVGKIELSGSSLSSTLIAIPEAVIMGFTLAITATAAKLFSNKKEIRKIASCGYFVTLILSAILTLSLFLASESMINLMFSGAEQVVKHTTNKYFRIQLFALPFYAVDFTSSAIMRASGDSKTPLKIMVGANCINLVCIYLCLHIFHFDYRSAAVCYVLSFILSSSVKLLILMSGKYRFTMRFENFSPKHFKQLLKLGIPCMLERSLIQFAFLGIQTVTSLLGTATLAGYQAANNIISFVYTFTGGLEIALVSLVGRYKYENKKAASCYVGVSYKFGMLVTCIVGVIMFIFAESFVSIFAKEKDVIESAAEILRYLVLTIPLTTGFQAGIGALKTGSDINYSLAITVISPNFIRVPIAYYLVSVHGLGFIGLYIGCVTDYAIRCAVVLWRIKKKKWLED